MKCKRLCSVALACLLGITGVYGIDAAVQLPATDEAEASVQPETEQYIERENSLSRGVVAADTDIPAERPATPDTLSQLTYEMLLDNGFGQSADALTTSLNLCTQIQGTKIVWESDNSDVITDDGRVIRPRYDKGDQQVTLTASAVIDGQTVEKAFPFTVLADEQPTDPVSYLDADGIWREYMSDEEFFGVWSDGVWMQEGKLDYTQRGLAAVETAVKERDYIGAKQALLAYMKNRDIKSPETLSPDGAATVMRDANVYSSGIYSLHASSYIYATASVTHTEYAETNIDFLTTNFVAKGGKNTIGIMAQYNEASALQIASLQHADASMHPRLELTVNGTVRTYVAEADTTTRAGAFENEIYGLEPDCTVKTFGAFLGDETYRTMLRFNFSDIASDDTVSAARLILYTRVENSSSGKKDIVVIREQTNIWEEETANYTTFTGYVYNFNGVPGINHWDDIPGADPEYHVQAARFQREMQVARAYLYTGDEDYAYYLINDIMDFIRDKGYLMKLSAWGDQQVRGGYPRTLDAAYRSDYWIMMLDGLLKSPYMTPDVITAIMKQLWDTATSIQDKSRTAITHAWTSTEQMSILRASIMFPEFACRQTWIDRATEKHETFLLEDGIRPDGSMYTQADSYVASGIGRYETYLKFLDTIGIPISPEIYNLVYKGMLYSSQLLYPNGERLQWGDSTVSVVNGAQRPGLAALFQDPQLTFVDSQGQQGEKPDWTSMYFPEGRTAIMRSDWGRDGMFMFTNALGGGPHSHQDDNAVLVYAYDKILLSDSGIFSYDESDPLRIWGKGTSAHNTVEINGQTQRKPLYGYTSGETYGWVSNQSFDFLSQSTAAYQSLGFDHRRTITFVKPYFWIVSDLMTPEDLTTENTYRQFWHMRPLANMDIDPDTNTMFSNYDTGANMIIGNGDRQTEMVRADGWYDYNYQSLAEAKYGYYEKTAAGPAVINTVLLPAETGNPQLTVEEIDLGVPQATASALKFDSVVQGEKNTTYYLLDYEDDPAVSRTFADYQSNGRMALVRQNPNDGICEVVLVNGSRLTHNDGRILLSSPVVLQDITYQITTDNLQIIMSEPEKTEGLRIDTPQDIAVVTVNGQHVAFIRDGDSIVLTEEKIEVKPPQDSSGGKGGVSSGGGGGGSIGGGTEPVVTPPDSETPPEQPEQGSEIFEDMQGHWAEEAVVILKEKGIVQGKADGKFYPEQSITRAEALAMIMRASDISERPYENNFTDVKAGEWYSGMVAGGLDAGLIAADTVFRPNDTITRQEAAKLIATVKQIKLGIAEPPPDYAMQYTDETEISPWAREYVRYVSYFALMQGYEDGSFLPAGRTTRAEMAVMIGRML